MYECFMSIVTKVSRLNFGSLNFRLVIKLMSGGILSVIVMNCTLLTCLQGYYRRASANMAVGKFKQALRDYEAVKTARPRDKDAVTKFTECSKIVRRMAFERAIAVEDAKRTSETIDLESMGEEV